MIEALKKSFSFLTPQEKRRGGLVMIMVIIMAPIETAGVASIMPFLSVLGNPEIIEQNAFYSAIYETLGFTSSNAFLRALGVMAFCILVLGAAFRIATNFALNRYANMRRHSISARLLETYLNQPYEYFLNRHSGDLSKGILSEVDQLVQNVFKPGVQMIAHSVTAVAIISLLVAIDPWLALIVGLTISGAYGAIFLALRGMLAHIGRDRADANSQRFTAAGEAIAGIKEIKLLGREQAYLDRFHGPSVRNAKHQGTNQTLAEVPKYLIEGVAFGGILALALYLHSTRANLGEVLPVLGLYAFAGYRLMPAAQTIYQGLARLRFGSAVIDDVYADLHGHQQQSRDHALPSGRLVPRSAISLRDVNFTFPGSERTALKGINLEIPVGAKVGIVGATGSGKTTTVDLILGLLRPTEGGLMVDDQLIVENNLRAWQRSLGYVPQEIFLNDATVAQNIAFGIPENEIDHAAVERAARMAELHSFVTQEMPEGYNTMVGERGVRLSGGQRQRIGIARALYHQPEVLILDEATSALDGFTEKIVMDAVHNLGGRKTIILVAHRLSTVRSCDIIYLLDHGRVQESGSFNDLSVSSRQFQKLSSTT